MSDLQNDTPRPGKLPAVPVQENVTDSLGRVLSVKKLDAVEELDLIEAAGGENGRNARWMMQATLAACVRDIDTVPVMPAWDRESIRKNMRRIGSEGIAAVLDWYVPDADTRGRGDDDKEAAKN